MPYLSVPRSIDGGLASQTAASPTSWTVQHLRSLTTHGPFPSDIAAGFGTGGSGAPSQQSLDSLKLFVQDLFFRNFDHAGLIQLLVTASFIAFVLVLGGVLVLHRIFHKKFWIFRFTRRAEGTYIVPNALNCFLLFEAIFGILLITYNVISWQLFENFEGHFNHQLQLCRLFTWIPLYVGAFLAGWGSFYTAPGALDRTNSTDRGRMDKILGLLPKPLFVNVICLGTPFLLTASIIAPSVLSQVQLSNAYNDYVDWTRYVDSLSVGNGTLTAPSAQEVLSRASGIWNDLAKSYWYVGIGYAVWAFWALVFLVFYIPSGGYLVFLLRQQVKKQKELFLAHQRDRREETTAGAATPPSSSGTDRSVRGDGRGNQSQGTARLAPPAEKTWGCKTKATGRFQPLILPSSVDNERTAANRDANSQDSSTAVPDDGMSPPTSPVSPKAPHRTVTAEVRDVFFPPLRPDFRKQATRRLSSHASPSSRFKYLRRCMINLIMLYAGVVAAAIIFAYIAIRLAADVYEAALRGPDSLARIFMEGQLLASYASCVFGFLTVGSIWLRNFDSDAPERDQSSNDNRRKRTRFARNSNQPSGRHHTDNNLQEKTRTLPAVPESVGIETTMHASSRDQDVGEMMSGMKFSLATDSVHPGALVLRPDDPSANHVSQQSPELDQNGFAGSPGPSPRIGSETRTSRKMGNVFGSRGHRPWGASAGRIEEDPVESFPQDELESREIQPSSPQVFYPTPYGPMPGPPSSNGHGSLRSNPTTPKIGSALPRTGSQSSLALLAAQHAQEQLETEREQELRREHQHQQQQQQQVPSAAHDDVQIAGLLPMQEAVDDADMEEMADPQERLWVRRSSRSGAIETAASKIARDWQASQYMNTPLPQTPSQSSPSRLSAAATLLESPTMAAAAASWTQQRYSSSSRQPSVYEPLPSHFTPNSSSRAAHISLTEAILTGKSQSPSSVRTPMRRPSLPAQKLAAAAAAAEGLTSHPLSAPLEPSPPRKPRAPRTANLPDQTPPVSPGVATPPTSPGGLSQVRLSPGVFF